MARPFSGFPLSKVSSLSLTSKTTALDLTQGLGTTQESNQTYNPSSRQHLEQGPVIVVEEEDALHRNNRAEEQNVRNGSRGGSFAQVSQVGTEVCPLY